MAQRVFQCGGNIVDACFRSLPYVAAGMEIVEISGQRCHAAQVIFQHFCRKGTGFGIGSAEVHGIGTVGNQRAELMFPQHGNRFCCVNGIFFLCLAAPGIAGEEGEGIGTDGQCRFYHGGIAAAC